MMTLPQFLKTIDQTTAAMPKEELAAFIHDIARTLPEIEREDFLARLTGTYGNTTPPTIQPKIQEPASKEEFTQKHRSLKAQLERIESWDIALEGCLNQDYDDWYDSADEEFRYSDPEGVVDIIQEACTFVHRCIDCEEYEAAAPVGQMAAAQQGKYFLDIRMPDESKRHHCLQQQECLANIFVIVAIQEKPSRFRYQRTPSKEEKKELWGRQL